MNRDMDTVRAVLLAIEADPNVVVAGPLSIPGKSAAEVSFHAALLADAGFISVGRVFSPLDGDPPRYHGVRLTWSGTELLDTIRDDEVWRTAKAGARKAGVWSISAIAEIAKAIVMNQLRGAGLIG